MLELETLNALYSDRRSTMTPSEIQLWHGTASRRLREWYTITHGAKNQNLAQTIQFNELIFNFLLFRLNRPSPGYPIPTLEMLQQSISAALRIISIYTYNAGEGLLFYIWHAMQQLFELTVFFLQLILGAIQSFAPADLWILNKINLQRLDEAVEGAFNVMWRMSERWPETGNCIACLQYVSKPILLEMQNWLQQDRPLVAQLDSRVEAQMRSLVEAFNLPFQQTFSTISNEGITNDLVSHITPILLDQDGSSSSPVYESLSRDAGNSYNTTSHQTLVFEKVSETTNEMMTALRCNNPYSPGEGYILNNDLWEMSSEQLDMLFGALDPLDDDLQLSI
jgi:hypothetical protein